MMTTKKDEKEEEEVGLYQKGVKWLSKLQIKHMNNLCKTVVWNYVLNLF